jgi:hypothetical protein
MRKKITNKKITASITLNKKILDVIDNNFSNRSKFIENLIIEELCKSDNIKEELIKIKIII